MSGWAYLVAFVGSAVLSAVLVAASIHAAHRLDMLDHPDGGRKIQERPIPKLGGVAVAAAFVVVTGSILGLTTAGPELPLALGVLLPALGAAVLGYLDDRRPLGPWVRLTSMAGLALAAWWGGTRTEVTGLPGLDLAITVFWIVLVMNGVNLLDNSDGLAGATVLVSSLGAGLVAAAYGQYLVAALGFALAGIAAGFLWHNWHPATVYMGDSGAYFLGFLLAVLTLRLRPENLSLPWSALVPLLLVALPLVDTGYVVVKRVSQGVHPFTAGRDHLSHVLQGRGHSVPRSVVLLESVLLVSVVTAVGVAASGLGLAAS